MDHAHNQDEASVELEAFADLLVDEAPVELEASVDLDNALDLPEEVDVIDVAVATWSSTPPAGLSEEDRENWLEMEKRVKAMATAKLAGKRTGGRKPIRMVAAEADFIKNGVPLPTGYLLSADKPDKPKKPVAKKTTKTAPAAETAPEIVSVKPVGVKPVGVKPAVKQRYLKKDEVEFPKLS